ncbi:uncharacterized protein BCR38DRAFT_484690 [Pseudomassariella vexata]|uniref:Inner centromere protein ARK-binding domain-containing protein n=1 Tax=Pseudomassariella vexata TaxID=1141098 RepID=A0A1Y2E197_9PEZI|nr:uncharacterized protein BCR38DRAFT_484690 [Pseudomassariella vexata]ORY65247.1 hypothetical protein BCR38DRAFT_484690 [Pseudomassariella vexata]
MARPRVARLQVGSAPWIAEERSSALQIAQSEVEEFSFSARNDFEWLNEHMAELFSENQINVAEIFKTPGKLRGKTPRTVRKVNPGEARVPLSNIFSATPKGAPNPFAIPNLERSQTPKVQIAQDPEPQTSPVRTNKPASPQKNSIPVADSGYYGSQSQDVMDIDDEAADLEDATQPFSPTRVMKGGHVAFNVSSPDQGVLESPAQPSSDPLIEAMGDDLDTQYFTANVARLPSPTAKFAHESTTPAGSPGHEPESESPKKTSSPVKTSPDKAMVEQPALLPNVERDAPEASLDETSRSQSDGSSPIRPIVRKSSLNFASLPAREPITHKSIGNRISRTSHLDQNRTSYYNRHTGGKSLGNAKHDVTDDENDEMDIDDDDNEDIAAVDTRDEAEADSAIAHNKTYTQRLQDQISKLGQSQPTTSRPSKSIVSSTLPTTATQAPQSPSKTQAVPSPKTHTTPGAFPEDEDEDEDDWIEPLGPPDNASALFSPRPNILKSHSTDVMEGVSGKDTVSEGDFAVAKTRERSGRSKSPQRSPIPERTTNSKGHHKSASVPVLPRLDQISGDGASLQKSVSVSNPALATVSENETCVSPLKSPSRTLRDSPLKQVKNKLSSILKTSKGLLASSAAISAEGKSSLLSPSTTRLGLNAAPSTVSLAQQFSQDDQPLYPDLSRHVTDTQIVPSTTSPTRPEGRKTRASIEKEKAEEKRKEKEAKEARRMVEQMQKLEKAREQEREKARVFSKEQERIAAMEKQMALQKEQERREREKKTAAPPPTPTQPPKPTRTSPRKVKAQLEEEGLAAAMVCEPKVDEDTEIIDAAAIMPPPSVPRSAAPPSAAKGREIKRPMRPTKEPPSKAKQAPTVIRVNMGSQYHPSNTALASNLQDTLGPASSQSQPKGKPTQPALHMKSSLQSLKSSQSSTGRPKALEMAARRKEQEERDAQRKREAKAEMERKRAAMQEEDRRQEQQRRLEADKQKEEEKRQIDAKKNAQRQAIIEKAKQTRAPPPAVRPQANSQASHTSESQPNRPPSRLKSTANSVKPAPKRQLQQETKDSKRMRMTEEFDDDLEMENQPSLKGAPVRPSVGFKKVTAATMLPQSQKLAKAQDSQKKSMFPAGYTSAPQTGPRDLFKTTVTSQHTGQPKAGHPLDMAQVSKAAIPFAPNPNPAGPAHKTPARNAGVAGAKSVAKSATRSSPRFQNGESIELPEINTDDEDEYDDEEHKQMFASWTDSPVLRKALMEQETLDPMHVFGAPGPLNMEEVFSKSKERWQKFRARTSSANWSGADKLTEDDIRKDLAARDKLRREGGWSYEMSKEML